MTPGHVSISAIEQLLITAVITFGLAFSFTATEGPFSLFDKLRTAAANRWGEESWQHHGLNCQICASFYAAMPVAWWLETGIVGWLFAFGVVNVLTSISPE